MRYLSFFSGALGLDLGLERAGWHCLAANEIDSVTSNTIRANRPELPLFEADIRAITPATLRHELGSKINNLDAVVGGPPCQAFSTAGKRNSLNDERGNVFLSFLDLAIRLEPKYVVIENVRGLLSAPLLHRPHARRGERFPPLTEEEMPGGALKEIIRRLESAGYACSFNLYDSSHFNVPQVRERLVLIAAQGQKKVPHLEPTCSNPVTLREALRAQLGSCHCLPLRANQQKYLHLVPEGKNWRCLPPEIQKEVMGNAYFSSGGRTGFMRRLAWDKPSPTLLTAPNMPATLLAHPEENRCLSIEEYKRIQTFPEDFVLCGSLVQQYKQIGNAVPVEFARAIGEHVTRWDRRHIMAAPIRKRTSRYCRTDESTWVAR
ncbi:DNA cytosine methyltransferase [Kamptonema cortianum]|nr:DNA cytosine methyltransferase [Geitlerinema splendidum]MDK3162250.1 DNA cytosine methyltransferase [Kamptonema cortianum]